MSFTKEALTNKEAAAAVVLLRKNAVNLCGDLDAQSQKMYEADEFEALLVSRIGRLRTSQLINETREFFHVS